MEQCVRLLSVAGSFVKRLSLLRRYEYSLLEGYMPRFQARELARLLRERVPLLYFTITEAPVEESPPYLPSIKGMWSRLIALTTTLGVPRYTEIDPTILLTILFTIMYGMMFGDIGLGLVIFSLGIVFRKRAWLLEKYLGLKSSSVETLSLLMLLCGLSSTMMGLVYGAFFLVKVLPPLIAPIHEVEKMLGVALIFGVIQMILGISLNIVNTIMEGGKAEAIAGSKGLIGLAFYVTGLLLAYRLLEANFNFMAITTQPYLLYILLVLYLGVVLSPLHAFLKGEESLSTCLIDGAVEGLEVIIGFSANTLSYLRLAAFAVAHEAFSVMALQLGGSIGLLPSLAITNIIVLIFEGFAVGIQAARLSFYEFATKFFRGDGVTFEPLSRVIASTSPKV